MTRSSTGFAFVLLLFVFGFVVVYFISRSANARACTHSHVHHLNEIFWNLLAFRMFVLVYFGFGGAFNALSCLVFLYLCVM